MMRFGKREGLRRSGLSSGLIVQHTLFLGLSLCRLNLLQGSGGSVPVFLTHSFDLGHLWDTEKVWGSKGL